MCRDVRAAQPMPRGGQQASGWSRTSFQRQWTARSVPTTASLASHFPRHAAQSHEDHGPRNSPCPASNSQCHHRGGWVAPLGPEGTLTPQNAPRKEGRGRAGSGSHLVFPTRTQRERSRPLVWTLSSQISAPKGIKQTDRQAPNASAEDETAAEPEPEGARLLPPLPAGAETSGGASPAGRPLANGSLTGILPQLPCPWSPWHRDTRGLH